MESDIKEHHVVIVEDVIGTDLNSWASYVLVGRLIEDLHASQQERRQKTHSTERLLWISCGDRVNTGKRTFFEDQYRNLPYTLAL